MYRQVLINSLKKCATISPEFLKLYYLDRAKYLRRNGTPEPKTPIEILAQHAYAADQAKEHGAYMRDYMKEYPEHSKQMDAALAELDASIADNNKMYANYNSRVNAANDAINSYNDEMSKYKIDELTPERIRRSAIGATAGGTLGGVGGYYLSKKLGLQGNKNKLKRLAGIGLTAGSAIGGAALGGYLGNKTVAKPKNYGTLGTYDTFTQPSTVVKESGYRFMNKSAAGAPKRYIKRPASLKFLRISNPGGIPDSYDTVLRKQNQIMDWYKKNYGVSDDTLLGATYKDTEYYDDKLNQYAEENAKLGDKFAPLEQSYNERMDRFDKAYKQRDEDFDAFDSFRDKNKRKGIWDKARRMNNDAYYNRHNAVRAYGSVGNAIGLGLGGAGGYYGSDWASKKLGLKGQKGWRRAADIALRTGGTIGGALLGDRVGGYLGRSVGDKLLQKAPNINLSKIDV